jgi:hypothetical protein
MTSKRRASSKRDAASLRLRGWPNRNGVGSRLLTELVATPLLAEGVGFEPTVRMTHNGFRDRPIRPLSHPSGRRGYTTVAPAGSAHTPLSIGDLQRTL